MLFRLLPARRPLPVNRRCFEHQRWRDRGQHARPSLCPPRHRWLRSMLWGGLVVAVALGLVDLMQPAAAAAVAQTAPSAVLPTIAGRVQVAEEVASASFDEEFGLFNLFIIFFITLGPLKVIPPFVQLTQNASAGLRRQLAVRSTLVASIAIFLVVVLGQNLIKVWKIQVPALMIAGGVLLSIVSVRIILAQYEARLQAPNVPAEPGLGLAVTPLAFPVILPPFGIAIALTLMVVSTKLGFNPITVIGLIAIVMLLNLVCMLAARPIFKFIRPVTLRILGFTLSVMQFALGIQFVLIGVEIQSLIIRLLLQDTL